MFLTCPLYKQQPNDRQEFPCVTEDDLHLAMNHLEVRPIELGIRIVITEAQ